MDVGQLLIPSTPDYVLNSINEIVEANTRCFNESLKMVVIHGSIIKGGFIPGYSDIDIQFWLDSSCFGRFGLKLKYGSLLQHELDGLSFVSWNKSPVERHYLNYDSLIYWWTGYIQHQQKRTFAILYGEDFFDERFLATKETLYFSFQNSLYRLPNVIKSVRRRWAIDNKKELPSLLRFVGASLFNLVHSFIGYKTGEPLSSWVLTKEDSLSLFENLFSDTSFSHLPRIFYQSIIDWDKIIHSLDLIEKAISSSLTFLMKLYSYAESEGLVPKQEPIIKRELEL